MDGEEVWVLVLKIIVLASVLFVLFSIDFLGFKLLFSALTDIPMFIVSLLITIVLSYPIIRSKWTGWRLVVTIFIVFFGITVFLTNIETVVFLQYFVEIIPVEDTPGLFINGAIMTAIFSPLAVLVHGRMKGPDELKESNLRLAMPWKEWIWKLLSIAVLYMIIYILFGMLVFQPLAGEAFQEYYAGLELPAWILPFQVFRGLLWTGLALPVVRMMKGSWREAGLTIALLFSVLMGSLLLVPTEFMPNIIRLAHFVEVSSSNFLFGWIVVLVLNIRHRIPT